MNDCVNVLKTEDSISICFYVDNDKVMEIGDAMNRINEDAYMNGYNWDVFFKYYLEKNAPELLEGLDSDPESAFTSFYYDLTPENEAKAQKLADIMRSLIEDEEKIYQIIEADDGEIEWD